MQKGEKKKSPDRAATDSALIQRTAEAEERRAAQTLS